MMSRDRGFDVPRVKEGISQRIYQRWRDCSVFHCIILRSGICRLGEVLLIDLLLAVLEWRLLRLHHCQGEVDDRLTGDIR